MWRWLHNVQWWRGAHVVEDDLDDTSIPIGEVKEKLSALEFNLEALENEWKVINRRPHRSK